MGPRRGGRGGGEVELLGLGIQLVVGQGLGEGKPWSVDVKHASVMAYDILLMVNWKAASPGRWHRLQRGVVSGRFRSVGASGSSVALLKLDALVARLVRSMLYHRAKVHFDVRAERMLKFGECVI